MLGDVLETVLIGRISSSLSGPRAAKPIRLHRRGYSQAPGFRHSPRLLHSPAVSHCFSTRPPFVVQHHVARSTVNVPGAADRITLGGSGSLLEWSACLPRERELEAVGLAPPLT